MSDLGDDYTLYRRRWWILSLFSFLSGQVKQIHKSITLTKISSKSGSTALKTIFSFPRRDLCGSHFLQLLMRQKNITNSFFLFFFFSLSFFFFSVTDKTIDLFLAWGTIIFIPALLFMYWLISTKVSVVFFVFHFFHFFWFFFFGRMG